MTGRFWRVSTRATGPPLCVEGEPPGFDGLVGVGRAHDGEVGRGPQDGELLDRLVRGAVFAETDAVVREDVHDRRRP